MGFQRDTGWKNAALTSIPFLIAAIAMFVEYTVPLPRNFASVPLLLAVVCVIFGFRSMAEHFKRVIPPRLAERK